MSILKIKDKETGSFKEIVTIKGEDGKSGIYVGTEEPTDLDIKVWIDETGNVSEVIDNLESESSINILSAKQGKVLNEKIKGTILFEGSANYNTGNFKLSSSVNNFSYIEIFFMTNDSRKDSTKISTEYTTNIMLVTTYVSETYTYLKSSDISISGETVSFEDSRTVQTRIGNGVSSTHTVSSTVINITKIVGYI